MEGITIVLYLAKFTLCSCGLLLFGASRLMLRIAGNNSFIQNFAAFSLGLSIIVAGVSLGLFITQ